MVAMLRVMDAVEISRAISRVFVPWAVQPIQRIDSNNLWKILLVDRRVKCGV